MVLKPVVKVEAFTSRSDSVKGNVIKHGTESIRKVNLAGTRVYTAFLLNVNLTITNP